MFELVRRTPRLTRVNGERHWLIHVCDIERGSGDPLLGELVNYVCDAGQCSCIHRRELVGSWNGNDGIVERGTDATAAVGREDRLVRNVIGWACEHGVESADLMATEN